MGSRLTWFSDEGMPLLCYLMVSVAAQLAGFLQAKINKVNNVDQN